MVDETIIHALSSTKNQKQERDSEMHQTRKGNQWYDDPACQGTSFAPNYYLRGNCCVSRSVRN